MKKLFLASILCLSPVLAHAQQYTCGDLGDAIATNNVATEQAVVNQIDADLEANWPAIYENNQTLDLVSRLVGNECHTRINEGSPDTLILDVTNLAAQIVSQ